LVAVVAAPPKAKKELVSPTASPVASPTASPTLVVASEPATTAGGSEQHQVKEWQAKEQQRTQKRTKSAVSFLALSQRNQKKIFVGRTSAASAGPPGAKESAAQKPVPTLASFFSKK
jgi:hypothetical protein